MPRRLTDDIFGGTRMAYARMSELVSGTLTEGLGSEMGVESGGMTNVTTDLGTFEALSVSQTLAIGSLNGVAPVLTGDASISYFPQFNRRPPNVRITTAYAMDIGPVRLAWTQSEPQREPITGVMQLVATNFPATPRPLRQPQVFANPEPRALEPGSSLLLAVDVIGISPGNRNNISAPSLTPVTDSAGTQYRWTAPRGERWTNSPSFYLASATIADAGNYQLEVITATGAAQSAPVRVMITPPAPSSRLVNVASRAPTGHVADTLIAGIVLSPSPANASATRRLLFRAVGPALRDFGISDAETDPTLVIYDSANREIARCDNWDSSVDRKKSSLIETERRRAQRRANLAPRAPSPSKSVRDALAIRRAMCTFGASSDMIRRPLTPRVRDALRQLAAGPQDMRDDALLQLINDEMKTLPVDDIAYVRDRVRFSCPPCPMVQSVVLMLNGLIEVKNLNL